MQAFSPLHSRRPSRSDIETFRADNASAEPSVSRMTPQAEASAAARDPLAIVMEYLTDDRRSLKLKFGLSVSLGGATVQSEQRLTPALDAIKADVSTFPGTEGLSSRSQRLTDDAKAVQNTSSKQLELRLQTVLEEGQAPSQAQVVDIRVRTDLQSVFDDVMTQIARAAC